MHKMVRIAQVKFAEWRDKEAVVVPNPVVVDDTKIVIDYAGEHHGVSRSVGRIGYP